MSQPAPARIARAWPADLVRVLLTVLAAPLVALGWTAGAVVTVLAWSVAAVQVGWDDARAVGGPGRGEGRR